MDLNLVIFRPSAFSFWLDWFLLVAQHRLTLVALLSVFLEFVKFPNIFGLRYFSEKEEIFLPYRLHLVVKSMSYFQAHK